MGQLYQLYHTIIIILKTYIYVILACIVSCFTYPVLSMCCYLLHSQNKTISDHLHGLILLQENSINFGKLDLHFSSREAAAKKHNKSTWVCSCPGTKVSSIFREIASKSYFTGKQRSKKSKLLIIHILRPVHQWTGPPGGASYFKYQ